MKSSARCIVCVLCLCFAFSARAEEIKTSGRYRYAVENGGAVIVEYKGTAKNLVVPDTLGGKPVTAVGAFAFWQNEDTVSVTLPASVERIAPSAFGRCEKLKTILLLNDRYRFEDGALYDAENAALHTLLYACKREAFTVPQGVRAVAAYAFAHHDELTRVTLPDSLEAVGDSAFMWCASLEEISLPGGLTSIGRRAFYFCVSLRSVAIPGGVTEISDYAFLSCENLERVVLPDSLEFIGEGAFAYCVSLRDITPPPDAALKDYAFLGCPTAKTD